MSCRATGCDQREWMARKFCDRHWKMLPVELQIKLRKRLEESRRYKPTDAMERELQSLFAAAQIVIDEKETEQSIAAQIATFRTHMASVAGTVAALRTIPLKHLREQLSASNEALLATNPDEHSAVAQKIALDLELLEILANTSEKLGEAIKRFAPPAPAEVGE